MASTIASSLQQLSMSWLACGSLVAAWYLGDLPQTDRVAVTQALHRLPDPGGHGPSCHRCRLDAAPEDGESAVGEPARGVTHATRESDCRHLALPGIGSLLFRRRLARIFGAEHRYDNRRRTVGIAAPIDCLQAPATSSSVRKSSSSRGSLRRAGRVASITRQIGRPAKPASKCSPKMILRVLDIGGRNARRASQPDIATGGLGPNPATATLRRSGNRSSTFSSSALASADRLTSP